MVALEVGPHERREPLSQLQGLPPRRVALLGGRIAARCDFAPICGSAARLRSLPSLAKAGVHFLNFVGIVLPRLFAQEESCA